MKLNICGIYMWTNTLNGKRYIGQSVDLSKRLSRYKGGHFKGQRALYAAFKKYGKENFVFEILWSSTTLDIDALNNFERDFIYLFDTMAPNGYNLKEGGNNGKLSDETKKKIGESNKNISNETRQKMSEASKGNKRCLGRKLSEETKHRIGKANKRPILQYSLDGTLIREWDSAADAEKELNINKGIYKCLKGKSKTSGKFIWKYK